MWLEKWSSVGFREGVAYMYIYLIYIYVFFGIVSLVGSHFNKPHHLWTCCFVGFYNSALVTDFFVGSYSKAVGIDVFFVGAFSQAPLFAEMCFVGSYSKALCMEIFL